MAERVRPAPTASKFGLDFLTRQVAEASKIDNPNIPDLRKLEKTELLRDLQTCSCKLPNAYHVAVGTPLMTWLQGDSSDAQVFWQWYRQPESADESTQELIQFISDLIQAVLQNGGRLEDLRGDTDAFEEVVSDLYDGFLSAEDREGVKPPDYEKIPALVKWGNKEDGPYTLVPDLLAQLGIKTAIVSMPPGFAQTGIVGYTTLGHETTGHDILHADIGLLDEIEIRVKNNIKPTWLGHYWASVVDEAAADVIGLLNFGPAAAIGFLAFFRGWGEGSLRNYAPEGDPHPIDMLRGFLQVEVLNLISAYSGRQWASYVLEEVNKDLKAAGGKIKFPDGRVIAYDHVRPANDDAKAVQNSIKSFAKLVASSKLNTLQQHSLSEIQDWSNDDDKIVDALRQQLREGDYTAQEDFYAAHAVAAATIEALETDDEQLLGQLFERLIKLLDAMHNKNTLFSAPRYRNLAYFK